MAHLHYITKFTHYQSYESPVDIHNWRFIRHGGVKYKSFKSQVGVFMQTDVRTIFIPHITISDIMQFNSMGEHHKVTQFYKTMSHMSFKFCTECGGVGKLDWIQATCPSKRPHVNVGAKRYKRDESCHFILPGEDRYIFSKTMLNEGDILCPECKGHGVLLDYSYLMFDGLKFLNRLVEVKINK